MSDFIGASDRFAIISDFMEHRREIVNAVHRYRSIADAMMTMVEQYGFCPEVVDQYEDPSHSHVVFECEEENWTKFILLRTDLITGESMLYASDVEGAISKPLESTEDLVSYLMAPEKVVEQQIPEPDDDAPEESYFYLGQG